MSNVQYCIALLFVMLVLLNTLSFSQNSCDPPKPPDEPPPDPPCLACDPIEQIKKMGDGCAGGDCFTSSSSFSAIFIAGEDGIQKRNMNGVLIRNLPVARGNAISSLTTGMSGNLYASYQDSHLLSVFDSECNLLQGLKGKFAASGRFFIDKMFNINFLTNDGRSLLRYDQNFNPLSALYFPEPVKDIDIGPDKCMLACITVSGRVLAYDVCNNFAPVSLYRSISYGDQKSFKVLHDGSLLSTNGKEIQRIDLNGKILQTFDVPLHDNWVAIALDPDENSFWCADKCNSNIWKFDLTTGKAVSFFNSGYSKGSITAICAVIEGDDPALTNYSELSVNLRVLLQTPSVMDEEIVVSLRRSLFPYQVVDVQTANPDENGYCRDIRFENVNPGEKYYIVINHPKSLETWSSEALTIQNGKLDFDFSNNGSRQNEDDNNTQEGLFHIRAGDLNQDGIIDGSDLAELDNAEKIRNLRIATQSDSRVANKTNHNMSLNGIDLNKDNLSDHQDFLLLEKMSEEFVSANIPPDCVLTSELLGLPISQKKVANRDIPCENETAIDGFRK